MPLSPGAYRALADAVVVVHFGFVLFVLFGGLLTLRWPRASLLHLPCALWGTLIEFFGWICPLTPLEQSLRARGHQVPYAGDFVAHYLTGVLYPAGLTHRMQLGLGAVVLGINALVYGLGWRRRLRRAPPG